jgi:hypothetical protein
MVSWQAETKKLCLHLVYDSDRMSWNALKSLFLSGNEAANPGGKLS